MEKDAFPCPNLYRKVRASIHLGMRKTWIPIYRCLKLGPTPGGKYSTHHMHIIVFPDSDTSDIKYSCFQALSHCDQKPLLAFSCPSNSISSSSYLSTFPCPLSTSVSPVCFSHCLSLHPFPIVSPCA